MRIGLLLSIGLVVLLAWSRPAVAQAIRLDVREVPLEQALVTLSTQAGVDIVYAQRLVQGRATTCAYAGDDLQRALTCVLAETGLQARQLRRRQYVLVEARSQTAAERITLSGFVVDAETDEALPGAHIYLPTLRLGTVTNEAGYFALPSLPRGTHYVQASYLGYGPRDTLLAVQDGRAARLRLRPTTLASEGVVVEAPALDPIALGAVPGVVGVPVNRLEQLPTAIGEQDLLQALQWMPGVRKSGEVGGGLLVRGGEPDQNLYLIDGAPVYHPWHAFSLISTFQTDTFKDVRLYQGAFPAEHGGRLAAVLDAELKDGSRTTPHAVAALSATNGRLLVETPVTQNTSFMVSGRGSYLEKLIGREHPVEDASGRRDTLRTGYHFYDWSGKFTWRLRPQSRLSLSYYSGRDVLDLRLPFDLSFDVSSWLRPADLFFEVAQRWGNDLYSARFQHLHSRRLFLTATAYASRYSANEGAFVQPTSGASVASAYAVRLNDLGLKVDADYYASLSHQVRAGVQVVRHGFESTLDATVRRSLSVVDTLSEQSDRNAYEVAAYVQDAWQPTARWRIEPGLRLSVFDGGRYTYLAPRLSVRYTVHPERLVVRASAGQQVQYLHRLRDRNAFLYDLVSTRWVPASAAVRPGRSTQVSLGLESQPRPWLGLQADAYWRGSDRVLLPRDAFQEKDGLVGPGIEVGTLLGQYASGEARAYGVELGAQVQRGAWEGGLSYAGGRSLNRLPEQGETTYRPARFDVPRTLRGLVAWRQEHWDVALTALVRSGYPLTVPVARYALGGPLDDPEQYLYRPSINNGRLPPYFRLDLTVGHRFTWLGARWRTQVHLYNVINRRNVVGRSYRPASGRVESIDRYGVPLLPLFEIEMEL